MAKEEIYKRLAVEGYRCVACMVCYHLAAFETIKEFQAHVDEVHSG